MSGENRSQIKAGIVLAYMNTIIHNLIGILYTPFVISMLGDYEYGLYNMGSGVVGMLSVMHLGFGASYIRYYTRAKATEDPDEVRRVNGMFFTIFSVIASVVFLISAIIAINVPYLFKKSLTLEDYSIVRTVIFLLGCSLSITLLSSCFSSIIVIYEKFIYQRTAVLIKNILVPAVTMILLFAGYKSVSMAVIILLLNGINFLMDIYFVLFILKEKFEFRGIDWKKFKELGVFTFYIFFSLLASQISWQVDKVVLGVICGPVTVAIYTVSANLNTYYQQISSNMSGFFAPRINKHAVNSDKSAIDELFIKVGRLQFCILFFIFTAFIVFGRRFIVLWVGAGYEPAYVIMIMFMLCSIIPLSQTVGEEIQRAYFKHKFLNIVYAVLAVVNILISIPLSYCLGEIGAALGTFIVMILGNNIIANVYYKKVLHVDIYRYLRGVSSFLKMIIVPIGFCLCFLNIIKTANLIVFIMLAILYTLFYFGFLWLLCFNEEEKEIFRSIFKKVANKLCKVSNRQREI